MPKTSSHIKCSECGVFTSNSDHCENCGVLISYQKKVILKKEVQKQQRIDKAKWELEHPNLAIRLKQHPFFLYKVIGWILYSAFIVVSALGAFLAWFFAMVAAG